MEPADLESVLLRKQVLSQLGITAARRLIAAPSARVIVSDSLYCDFRGDQRFLNHQAYRYLAAALTDALARIEAEGPFTVEFIPDGQYVQMRICDPVIWTPAQSEPPSGCWLWPQFSCW